MHFSLVLGLATVKSTWELDGLSSPHDLSGLHKNYKNRAQFKRHNNYSKNLSQNETQKNPFLKHSLRLFVWQEMVIFFYNGRRLFCCPSVKPYLTVLDI